MIAKYNKSILFFISFFILLFLPVDQAYADKIEDNCITQFVVPCKKGTLDKSSWTCTEEPVRNWVENGNGYIPSDIDGFKYYFLLKEDVSANSENQWFAVIADDSNSDNGYYSDAVSYHQAIKVQFDGKSYYGLTGIIDKNRKYNKHFDNGGHNLMIFKLPDSNNPKKSFGEILANNNIFCKIVSYNVASPPNIAPVQNTECSGTCFAPGAKCPYCPDAHVQDSCAIDAGLANVNECVLENTGAIWKDTNKPECRTECVSDAKKIEDTTNCTDIIAESFAFTDTSNVDQYKGEVNTNSKKFQIKFHVKDIPTSPDGSQKLYLVGLYDPNNNQIELTNGYPTPDDPSDYKKGGSMKVIFSKYGNKISQTGKYIIRTKTEESINDPLSNDYCKYYLDVKDYQMIPEPEYDENGAFDKCSIDVKQTSSSFPTTLIIGGKSIPFELYDAKHQKQAVSYVFKMINPENVTADLDFQTNYSPFYIKTPPAGTNLSEFNDITKQSFMPNDNKKFEIRLYYGINGTPDKFSGCMQSFFLRRDKLELEPTPKGSAKDRSQGKIPDISSLCERIGQKDEDSVCMKCINGITLNIDGKPIPGIWTAIGCMPFDLPILFQMYITPYGIGMVGGIAFLYFIYGCFLILTSGGNAEKIEQAKQIIISALSGLILIIFSVLLLKIIGWDIIRIPAFNSSSSTVTKSQCEQQGGLCYTPPQTCEQDGLKYSTAACSKSSDLCCVSN